MESHHTDAGLLEHARHGDVRARERVVVQHLPNVRAIAWRYRNLGMPVDDLVQEGSIGLLDAIEHFDDSRGSDFERYARFRIRRAIRNALTEKSRLIRLPKQIVERRRDIERASARLAAEHGRPPTLHEVALALELRDADVVSLRPFAAAPSSLDQP